MRPGRMIRPFWFWSDVDETSTHFGLATSPGHLSDEAITTMLNELSTELGAALALERIYVAFADRTWILDAGER